MPPPKNDLKNGLTIEWSQEALTQLDMLYAYLESNWDDKSIVDFTVKLQQALSTIATFPWAFPDDLHFKTLKKCVVTKHNTL